MGRSNRLTVEGGIFHVTHRCHNQAFLLKFARDRNAYRNKLREGLDAFSVTLLDYTITSNHVHLLVDAPNKSELSGFMRKVAGETARQYNRRKKRTSAFWGDSFHATLIEEGRYLYECLLYIELNMVRCGVVSHPREWEWVGYHEITGRRKRYRLIGLERLCWRLGTTSLDDLRRNLKVDLDRRIAQEKANRIGYWTESLAVGSPQFLKHHQPLIWGRMETEIAETGDPEFNVLREDELSYNHNWRPKNGRKAVF